MYTSESGAKYRKARESRSRSYPDTTAIYEKAKASSPTKTKALEKGKYAPHELKKIGQDYKKLFDEQRYVDNRSSRRKHAKEYNKEHGTRDNR